MQTYIISSHGFGLKVGLIGDSKLQRCVNVSVNVLSVSLC